jgi:hypothetical protein
MNSRAIISSVLSVALIGLTSCSTQLEKRATVAPQPVADQAAGSTPAEANPQAASPAKIETPAAHARTTAFDNLSLAESESVEEAAAALDRKIVRNADLTMEVASTTDTQHRVVSIAEAHGGFVVTSEAKQRDNIEPAKRTLDIKLVVRVPENQFGGTLDQIRALGSGTPKEEKVTGQDVTEEYIDLEARIKTQKALEAQFLLIMKQAGKINDALEVQRQIAEVRTEIERLEGRKRFLENRSSLSTITVNLQSPTPIVVVPATGFRSSVRDAVSDSVDLGAAMVLFVVRSAIVMLPVFLLVLLPGALVLRYFIRRAKRFRLAAALSTPASD